MIFILSQKGYGICIFETPHDDMKFCWGIKELYLNAKIAYAQGRQDGQADRKQTIFYEFSIIISIIITSLLKELGRQNQQPICDIVTYRAV